MTMDGYKVRNLERGGCILSTYYLWKLFRV